MLTVSSLDEITGQELAMRRTALLRALDTAGTDTDPGTIAGALALVAVIAEQGSRARLHARFSGHTYVCKCGLRCTGLAAIDDHLDRFRLDDHAHYEITRRACDESPPASSRYP